MTGMTLIARIRHDPQRRTLAVLGAAALLFLLTAVSRCGSAPRSSRRNTNPRQLFADLDPNAVTAIRVTSRAGTFTVKRMGAHDWRIPEKSNFPADEDQVLAAVRGVASLEAIEPKTANPDWHSQLGLVAPEKGGDATELTLLDSAANRSPRS